MEQVTLATIRATGIRALGMLAAGIAMPVIGGALFAQPAVDWGALAITLLLLVEPVRIFLARRIDQAARITMALTVCAMPAMLLYVFSGYAYQSDLHMLFFAVLAVTAVIADWRAILAGTVVIALHHLILGLALPSWVFDDGGSLARIALHALILVIEAAALIWLSNALVKLLDGIAAAQATREAMEQAATAERAARAQTLETVIETMGQGLESWRQGDLATPAGQSFPAEFASLRDDFEATRLGLADLIAKVQDVIASIRTGSGEIAHASEDLARRTEGNAASLEETSAAIAQMDERLRASAAAAATTVERADGAITTVSGGRSVADQAVQAMGRVSESAKGIDSVIEGLDKIAFQTRVLAMNAAVEAGRAGDAGRGFAVVADLVSALAMRAEEEAKRARDQLTVTQSDIVCAVEMVQKVDGALADISGDVGQVHELLATMAADNQAQSSAITQISAAVGTMDQSTQQNAAMVEETSAAARNLTSEVQALSEQAARFKVDDRARRSIHAQVEAMKPKPRSSAYVSPVKPLAPAAISALTRPQDDDWNEF
ncbi:methyl-accepting chemotaxis protein [Sphingomonas sp. IC-11]|uniref:methyl-accepting chemotaxis protein n=1 Tax=Sphingomonas sp. IC-11 TaxID=2898528 RepID=UPI001E2B5F42|nr:methyl-accepting chemotaxis protein [Sphingomonas sp. IC-11]MCD2317053.1 methyl-accepting chemotaxis protein [Sphingomonas sp. IC-11]